MGTHVNLASMADPMQFDNPKPKIRWGQQQAAAEMALSGVFAADRRN